VGDFHVVVVNDDCQQVGRRAVGAEENEVVQVLVREVDAPLYLVVPSCRAFLRGADADDGLDSLRRNFTRSVFGTPSARVAKGYFILLSLSTQRLQFFLGAVALEGRPFR